MASAENWDQWYSAEGYLFGTEPSPFLIACQDRFVAGGAALALADGEGRNGVWLAEQGLDVLSIDYSETGLRKARALARTRGVPIRTERADMLTWDWPVAAFNVVCAMNFHFPPPARDAVFASIVAALKPGGLLVFEGIHKDTRDEHDPATLYDETMADRLSPGLAIESMTTYLDETEGRPKRTFLNILAMRR